VRERTQLPVQRNDFKLEQLSPHLFMNFRIVDEHGRQLGMGRDLASLKAELGHQARSAFQALAALKVAAAPAAAPPLQPARARRTRRVSRPRSCAQRLRPRGRAAHTAWTFGELPELLELRKGGQVLIGFPALIDRGTMSRSRSSTSPRWRPRHRAGLRRLVALQLREPLKYLEKNIPDLQKMAAAYMSLGTLEELREQIIDVALDRAFLADPLPTDARRSSARSTKGARG
jgi:ATP-dependent helicase HrpA